MIRKTGGCVAAWRRLTPKEPFARAKLAEKNAPPDRNFHLQQAHKLCAQSLDLWHDVQRNGMITAVDAGKPEATAHALAEYDALLKAPR